MLELIEAAILSAGEKLVQVVTAKAAKGIGEQSKEFHHKLIAQPKRIKEALERHASDRKIWCDQIFHTGMHKELSLNDIYLPLRANNDPKRNRMGKTDAPQIPLKDALESSRAVLITGDLGAGKTTTLKRYALDLWEDNTAQVLFIRFREFTTGEDFLSHLKKLLQLEIKQASVDPEDQVRFTLSNFEKYELLALASICNDLKLTILADGLDESPVGTREKNLNQLISFGRLLDQARIVLTSRPPEITVAMTGYSYFEVEPLVVEDARRFAETWFEKTESAATPDGFFEALNDAPYQHLIDRPLMLTNLCIIFGKDLQLPRQPVTLYRKILRLSLEEWDAQRGFRRETRYSELSPGTRLGFLSAFAYQLRLDGRGSLLFDTAMAEKAYRSIHEKFDLPMLEYAEVTREIESTTGIITQVTYDKFEFSHKSISEFLVAEYLVRSSFSTLQQGVLENSPDESAVATALSTDPTKWLVEIFLTEDRSELRRRPADWVATFIHRLGLEKPGLESNVDLACMTIWLGVCIYKENHVSANEQLLKFMEHDKVDRAMIKFFGAADLKHDRDSIQLELPVTSLSKPMRVGLRFAEFKTLFGQYFD